MEPGDAVVHSEPAADLAVERVCIWGLSLARVSYGKTLDLVDGMIRRGRPGYFITANLHYAMLSDRDPRLREANARAAFLLADGMPLVWYSRLIGRPLPERVTGADLVWLLCQRAVEERHRVFLLGGAPGVAQEAAGRFQERFPGLLIAGVEAPELERLSPSEHAALVARVRRAAPDLLLVALGQPKGELWLLENYRALGVPACVQVGATLDFVAGRLRRAPRWMQRMGAEWLFRMMREPRRLLPRYAADALFLVKAVCRDVRSACARKRQSGR